MPAVSLVSHLDRLFGEGFISFIRDPEKQTLTVSITARAMAKANLKPQGWNIVLGGSYRVKTLKETDWKPYLDTALREVRK